MKQDAAPEMGAKIDAETTLEFAVEGYDLGAQTTEDPFLAHSGKGQHIHVVVDNAAYTAHYDPSAEIELEPHVPAGVEDGRAFASVVAFDVLDTRVLGVPMPGFRNFPEVNLRFYVRRGEDFARSLSGGWRSSPVSARASPAWSPRVHPGERGP